MKWQKFANSLRLRYAMRMVNKEPILAGDIIKEIFENQQPVFGANEFGQLNNDPNECAALYPYQLGYRNESKGWSFNQSKDVRMGTNIWHLLSKHDSTDGSGIFDPRAYYFFETNNNGDWVAFLTILQLPFLMVEFLMNTIAISIILLKELTVCIHL